MPLREVDGQLVGPASLKALRMRGYDVESPIPQDNKSIIPEAIPEDEGWGSAADPEALIAGVEELKEGSSGILGDTVAAGYNTTKTMADLMLQTLPAAETILNPVGKYSGLYEYFKTLGSTEVQGKDFVKIAKNQMENPEIRSYLEGYKQEFALDETKIIGHLNQTLGLDVVNLKDLENKYKGNKQVADSATAELRKLEETYLTDNDWYEDEDFYYIKNFKEMPGVNVAWTEHGDLQMPHLGIFKFDDTGQGSMMRHSATNLKGSWNPITSFIGEQGFGTEPKHNYDIELYGDQGAQSVGFGLGSLGLMFAPQGARSAMAAPGLWNKAKQFTKATVPLPKTAKGVAGATGIATVPMAGYFDVFK